MTRKKAQCVMKSSNLANTPSLTAGRMPGSKILATLSDIFSNADADEDYQGSVCSDRKSTRSTRPRVSPCDAILQSPRVHAEHINRIPCVHHTGRSTFCDAKSGSDYRFWTTECARQTGFSPFEEEWGVISKREILKGRGMKGHESTLTSAA